MEYGRQCFENSRAAVVECSRGAIALQTKVIRTRCSFIHPMHNAHTVLLCPTQYHRHSSPDTVDPPCACLEPTIRVAVAKDPRLTERSVPDSAHFRGPDSAVHHAPGIASLGDSMATLAVFSNQAGRLGRQRG